MSAALEFDVEDARDLFSLYFIQDWPDLAPNREALLSLYLRQMGVGCAQRALRQIDQLVALDVSDVALRDIIFTELESGVLPKTDEAQAWLSDIRRQLAALCAAQGGEA